jgi:membrane-bound ClpP family serine protease
MKKIYLSKINWAMVLLAAIGILQIVQEWYAKSDFSVSGIVTLAIAVLVFCLRTFYTDQAIDTPKARAKLIDQSGAVVEMPTRAEVIERR